MDIGQCLNSALAISKQLTINGTKVLHIITVMIFLLSVLQFYRLGLD